VRVTRIRAVLSAGPSVDTLPAATIMRVVGVSGASYRVELPDSRVGYVSERLVQPATSPSGQTVLSSPGSILERPLPGAVVMETLKSGTRVGLLGVLGQYQMVRSPGGGVGWIRKELGRR
jgi:hypothetical protein